MAKISMENLDEEPMTYQEFDEWLIREARNAPTLRGDRSLVNSAKNAEQGALTTAGSLGSTAAGIGGQLIPGLEKQAANPPGMNPNDLANEQAQSQEAAGGTAGALKGALATRAMRMGNPANLNATAAAVGQGASRAEGQATQDVLSANAGLKEKQRSGAQSGLEGLYGTDTRGMVDAMGLAPQDINAGTNADKVGWYQNMLGGIEAVTGAANAGANIAKA